MDDKKDMTNSELKIWLTGEFRVLRTEMNSEFKLVREEIKTGQSEVQGEIKRIDARLDGQMTLIMALMLPVAIPILVYLVGKAWDMAKLKFGDVIKKKNQPELRLGDHPRH